MEEKSKKGSRKYRRTTRPISEHLVHKIEEDFDEKVVSPQEIQEQLEEKQGYRQQRRNLRHEVRHSASSNRLYYFPLLLLSFVLALTFYSFPLFHRLPTGATAVNLFSGFAMQHGFLPYNDFFGNAGPLFYLVNQIGVFGNSTFILWLLEVLALWISGLLIFNFFVYRKSSQKLGFVVALFSVIAIAGISMGGSQAVIFGLPFALYGVQVLSRYFEGSIEVKDEVFILYGASGAFAGLFFPAFFILWFFAFFGLFAFNIKRRLFGRGLYQFLAGLFGFLLVNAIVGYYTLTSQIFFSVIEQAILLPFTHYNTGMAGLLNLGISFGLLLIFGLIASLIFAFNNAVRGSHKVWTIFLIFVALVSLVLVSFMNGYSPADALVVLPYLFMFMGLHLDETIENRERQRLSTGHVITRYIKSNLLLPILGLIFLIAFPFAHQRLNVEKFQLQNAVARYLKDEAKAKDEILVLPDSPNINRLSGKFSPVVEPPSYYPKNYQQDFEIQAARTKSRFIIVAKGHNLPSEMNDLIKTNYRLTNFEDGHFKIYRLK